MKKCAQLLILLSLTAFALAAGAQGRPPPGAGPGYHGGQGPLRDQYDAQRDAQREAHRSERMEQREERRRENRQHREMWQQMSPEERHQLRRDIRDAGQDLYPPKHQRRRD